MCDSDVSLITATYQSDCFIYSRNSIDTQTVPVHNVVVDGGSGPSYTDAIQHLLTPRDSFLSEPDDGIYDAINKGISLARGSIVGILHSDDRLNDSKVIGNVINAFHQTGADVVYGDLVYVNDRDRVVRFWRSKPFNPKSLVRGWMPPHPTVFVRREVFQRIGVYDTSYRIAGDYEFLLRLFKTTGLRFFYLPIVITRMRLGGVSNRDLKHIVLKMREDAHAMRAHGLNPWITLPAKNIRKLIQFVRSQRVTQSSRQDNVSES